MPHTRTWEEANPPGSQAAAQGATRIRDMKVDITERMAIDHYWDVDQNTDGWHKQVTLPEGADPAAVANQGKVYSKDNGGVTHLYYRDSAGTIYQLSGALSNVTIPWASITGIPTFVGLMDGLVDPGADSFLVWDFALQDWTFTSTSASSFDGVVDDTGSAVHLPAGWLSGEIANIFTVTHNLGHTDYGLQLTCHYPAGSDRLYAAQIESKDANSFSYRIASIQDENDFTVHTTVEFKLTLF